MNSTLLDAIQQRLEASRDWSRPMVTVSYAQSIDGCLSEARGVPSRLSGEHAMQMTHALRSLHQGILVGRGTFNADNPQLTVRLVQGPSPQPIILSGSLALNTSATLLTNARQKPWIATGDNAPEGSMEYLRQVGCRIFRCRCDGRWIHLPDLLRQIRREGIRSVMIEGGGQVIDSFFHYGLVDLVVVTLAPVMMAGETSTRLTPRQRVDILHPESMTLGNDIVFWGSPCFASKGASIAL